MNDNMRTISLSLSILALLLLPSCNWWEDENPVPREPVAGKYVLLQIDYQTLAFEGGKVYDVTGTAPTTDALPVFVTYTPPGDFGDLGIYSSLDSSQLFFGTIVWDGSGDRTFPAELDPVSAFPTTDDIPDILPVIQNLNPQPEPDRIDESELWSAVHHLQIMADAATTEGARFGWVLYPRSVGIGNPAEWDFYLVAYVPE
jgi:hypothetical protein